MEVYISRNLNLLLHLTIKIRTGRYDVNTTQRESITTSAESSKLDFKERNIDQVW